MPWTDTLARKASERMRLDRSIRNIGTHAGQVALTAANVAPTSNPDHKEGVDSRPPAPFFPCRTIKQHSTFFVLLHAQQEQRQNRAPTWLARPEGMRS